MGKTRDVFKKIRDTKGTFHAKMGSIKDRNGMDLTEAEDIKKRQQEYTGEGNGTPLQCSCLENPRDRGTWWAAVCGVAQSRTRLKRLSSSSSSSKNTQKNCTKYLQDPDSHDGVITHLEPDILDCELKWALGSITMNKASGGDGTPVELFQTLEDDAVKSFSHVQLVATPWTAACQAPPSMGFARQEYWSGVPLPSLQI